MARPLLAMRSYSSLIERFQASLWKKRHLPISPFSSAYPFLRECFFIKINPMQRKRFHVREVKIEEFSHQTRRYGRQDTAFKEMFLNGLFKKRETVLGRKTGRRGVEKKLFYRMKGVCLGLFRIGNNIVSPISIQTSSFNEKFSKVECGELLKELQLLLDRGMRKLAAVLNFFDKSLLGRLKRDISLFMR